MFTQTRRKMFFRDFVLNFPNPITHDYILAQKKVRLRKVVRRTSKRFKIDISRSQRRCVQRPLTQKVITIVYYQPQPSCRLSALQEGPLALVLLDSGSMNNFTSTELVNSLSLKQKRTDHMVSGIGEITQNITFMVWLKIKSCVNDYELNMQE